MLLQLRATGHSYVYNFILETFTSTDLDIWYAVETVEGNRTSWHYIGAVNKGNHSISMNTNTRISGTTYRINLGTYGTSKSNINTVGINRFLIANSTAGDVENENAYAYIFDSPYTWNCTVNQTGCCILQLRVTTDTAIIKYDDAPCNDEQTFNFITNREMEPKRINNKDNITTNTPTSTSTDTTIPPSDDVKTTLLSLLTTDSSYVN